MERRRAGGESDHDEEEDEEKEEATRRREIQKMRAGVTKKITRGAIKLIRGGGVNEVEGWRGGDKGQQVFIFICCSISVIDLVFSNQPLGLSHTHTHTHTHR